MVGNAEKIGDNGQIVNTDLLLEGSFTLNPIITRTNANVSPTLIHSFILVVDGKRGIYIERMNQRGDMVSSTLLSTPPLKRSLRKTGVELLSTVVSSSSLCRKWDEESWSSSTAFTTSTAESTSTAVSSSVTTRLDRSDTATCVRFVQDTDGQILPTIYWNETELAESEISDAWYTDDECHAMKIACRDESESAWQSDYHQQYMHLYYICGEDAMFLEEEEQEVSKEGNHYSIATASTSDGEKCAIRIASSFYRGCERLLYHGRMNRLVDECIDSVLDLQDAYRFQRIGEDNTSLTGENDSDDCICCANSTNLWNELATRSRHNSRRYRRIAYLLALGDAVVVQSDA